MTAPEEQVDAGASVSLRVAVREAIALILPYVRHRRWAVPATLVAGLLASAAESAGIGLVLVLLSLMLRGTFEGEMVEDDLIGRTITHLTEWSGGRIDVIAVATLALIGLRIAIVSGHQVLTAWLSGRISHEVRVDLIRVCIEMPFARATRRSRGELLAIIQEHGWSVAEATESLITMLMAATVGLLIGGLLLILSPVLALVALVGAVLLSFAVGWLHAPAHRAGVELVDATRDMGDQALRTIHALRTVRAFGLGQRRLQWFAHSSDRLRGAMLRADVLAAASDPASQIAALGVVTAIGLVAAWQGLDYAAVLLAVGLLYRLQTYVSDFEAGRIHLASLLQPLRAVSGLLNEGAESTADGTEPFSGMRHGIVLRGVHFSHHGQSTPALNGVSATIRAGEWTQIAGDSGAGKSSLINLLLRFYLPDRGTITVDGRPLASLARDQWLGRLALAGQDVELIDGTIADNIRIGAPDADAEMLARAIVAAGLHRPDIALPQGVDTLVGEFGTSLSGGQRQRVGLARALARDPDVLILDEAMSALDIRSQRRIYREIARMMAGRTVILIAHHLPPEVPVDTIIALPPSEQRDAAA